MNKDALDDYPSKQEILNTVFDAVYAQYSKKEWQGLTNDEVNKLHKQHSLYKPTIRKIEAMIKEKNT